MRVLTSILNNMIIFVPKMKRFPSDYDALNRIL